MVAAPNAAATRTAAAGQVAGVDGRRGVGQRCPWSPRLTTRRCRLAILCRRPRESLAVDRNQTGNPS
jgi:hypothetical protein